MEKLIIKQIKENLKEIQEELNQHEEWEQEYWTYKLSYQKSNVIIKIYDDDECNKDYLEDTFVIERLESFDMKSILKSIINYIYENHINFRNNYIHKTTSFNNRKIKSLALWSSRNKIDRVDKINEELVQRYNTTQKMKAELEIYKDYVRDLYSCLTKLCPFWKVQDMEKYINQQLEKCNIHNVKVFYKLEYLIACQYNNENYKAENWDKYDKRISVEVNSYSRKNEIWSYIFNRLKEA